MYKTLLLSLLCVIIAVQAQDTKEFAIDCVWLTHSEPAADSVTVCWTSPSPGDARVRYGLEGEPEKEVTKAEQTTLHQVKIHVTKGTKRYRYQVFTGNDSSRPRTFKQYPDLREPGAELRIVIFGNRGYWNYKRTWKAVYAVDAHMGFSVGDNVPRVRDKDHDGEAAVHNLANYVKLVRSQMTWFATTPFLPVMGNHDHEIRSANAVAKRQLTPEEMKNHTAEMVHDIAGTAFCEFFPLPDKRWIWHFDVPGTPLRFIGLDLNHDRDYGTTHGSCHAYHPESEQYTWLKNCLAEAPDKIRVVLHNSAHSVGNHNDNALWKLFNQCKVIFSGNSYSAARDRMPSGILCYTTSLPSKDTVKPRHDEAHYAEGVDNFTLITVTADKMRIELRKLEDGSLLDRAEEIPL